MWVQWVRGHKYSYYFLSCTGGVFAIINCQSFINDQVRLLAYLTSSAFFYVPKLWFVVCFSQDKR